MDAPEVFALVLAGGGGTRLWPASRRSRPKQLLTLGGSESLLAATVRRAAAVVGREGTLVVTAADQLAAVRAAVPALPAANVIAEPAPRNTAAAVGLGAVHAARRGGDGAVLAVLPSDAFIGDEAGFAAVLRVAIAEARAAIVTVGIRPTGPETGFGYLEQGRALADGVFEVARFVEKPDAARAAEYVAARRFLWNSGMFFFTAGRFFDEARRHLPELGRALDAFRAAADLDAEVAARYPALAAVSIDFGIMEKASGIRVIPGAFGWNDVGGWAALPAIRPIDAAGNVVAGDALVRDSTGSVVIAEPGAPMVGVVGAEDLVVVATRDAVLVVPRRRAQDVRALVEALAAAGRKDVL